MRVCKIIFWTLNPKAFWYYSRVFLWVTRAFSRDNSSLGSNGLDIYSSAPIAKLFILSSAVPMAVKITTGILRFALLLMR